MWYRSFASLGRFIPRYFILFEVMVNGIVTLISLSDLSLLVYRKGRDICMLSFYPETLPNSLMNSSRFQVASLGLSTYRIMLGFPGGSDSKESSCNAGDLGSIPGLGLEKEIATHSSILAWINPWTEEPGGLQTMGLQRLGHD